jgi:hypothetical protein
MGFAHDQRCGMKIKTFNFAPSSTREHVSTTHDEIRIISSDYVTA